MTTYSQLNELLAGARGGRKKVANNTYAVRREDGIAIILHATDIVTFTGGSVRYDTGGWRTTVTKERMNSFGQSGITVYSKRGDWRVSFPGGDVPFVDGITFAVDLFGKVAPVDGTYPDPSEEERLARATQKLAADIKAYCEKAKPILVKWQATLKETGSLNTAGDCLFCKGMVTEFDGGPSHDISHLWSHLREQYVFPTLYVNAYAAKGYKLPAQAFGTAVLYGHHDEVCRVLTGYLKKNLAPHPEPEGEPDGRLLRYAEAAKEALQRPSDFGYFGSDDHLWRHSAPTWTKTRDSENYELANYEVVWTALKAEFPDLFAHLDGDERAVDRDFNEWPAIYEFGAGHWAVGHIDQIVVPVVADPERPVGPDNLHPAFIRIMEFVDAAKDYPTLDGAEDIEARLDAEDALGAAQQYLGADVDPGEAEKVIAVILDQHGDVWSTDGEDWFKAARQAGVDPGDYLTGQYGDDEQQEEQPVAPGEGQGTLL